MAITANLTQALEEDKVMIKEWTNQEEDTHTQTISAVKTYTAIPVFNGGATGTTPPFTVDSETVVPNLNADMLDGYNLNEFGIPLLKGFKENSQHGTFNGDLDAITENSIYNFAAVNVTNEPSGLTAWGFIHTFVHANGPSYITQMVYSMNISPASSWIRQKKNDVWEDWSEIWNSGNMGSGSGLDADLLDNVQGSDYAKVASTSTLHTTDALRVSGGSIYLHKGNGTSESVAIPNEVTWVANDSRAKTALNATGSAPIYACRAWGNLLGSSPNPPRASGNVASVTHLSAGRYQINFINPMVDENYSTVAITSAYNGSGSVYIRTQTTSYVDLQAISNGAGFNPSTFTFSIHR